MNNVSSISRSRVASTEAVPSTFETKRNVSAGAGADDTDVQPVARLPNRAPLQEKPSIWQRVRLH
jgi:hypothetical protein